MTSDISATGEIPALEPETGPTALAARQTSGLAALAPDPARGVAARGLARPAPAEHEPAGRGLTVVAAAGIGIAILIMIAVSLVRSGWMMPSLVMPAVGPP